MRRQRAKSEPKAKPTPLEEAQAKVAKARGEFDRAMALLEQARATVRAAFEKVKDAEAERASFVFGSMDEAANGLLS